MLADKSAQFLELFCRIKNETTMVSREAVEAQGVDYISLLRKHMSKEESRVFPRAHQVLVDDDWQEIRAVLKEQEDPVFGKIVAEEYHTLYDAIVL